MDAWIRDWGIPSVDEWEADRIGGDSAAPTALKCVCPQNKRDNL